MSNSNNPSNVSDNSNVLVNPQVTETRTLASSAELRQMFAEIKEILRMKEIGDKMAELRTFSGNMEVAEQLHALAEIMAEQSEHEPVRRLWKAMETKETMDSPLKSDYWFRLVFHDDEDLMSEFLRDIVGDRGIQVVSCELKRDIFEHDGAMAYYHTFTVEDSAHNVYSVGIENETDAASDEMMVTQLGYLLEKAYPGEAEPAEPRAVWTINICRDDPRKENRPLYMDHVQITASRPLLNMAFLNSAYREDEEISGMSAGAPAEDAMTEDRNERIRGWIADLNTPIRNYRNFRTAALRERLEQICTAKNK